jgi:DNA-binding FrmR family transcriptional regulator
MTDSQIIQLVIIVILLLLSAFFSSSETALSAVSEIKVKSMVEEGADCTDVLIQLAAVRGQMDGICSCIMAQYTDQIADEYRRSGDPALLKTYKTELFRAIKK